jgi:hypothetical protein
MEGCLAMEAAANCGGGEAVALSLGIWGVTKATKATKATKGLPAPLPGDLGGYQGY